MFGISLKKKMTFLRKDKVLAHGKTNFWWSSKIEMLQLWSKLPVKIKRSVYIYSKSWYAKIEFVKIIHRKEVSWKETYDTDLWLYI